MDSLFQIVPRTHVNAANGAPVPAAGGRVASKLWRWEGKCATLSVWRRIKFPLFELKCRKLEAKGTHSSPGSEPAAVLVEHVNVLDRRRQRHRFPRRWGVPAADFGNHQLVVGAS